MSITWRGEQQEPRTLTNSFRCTTPCDWHRETLPEETGACPALVWSHRSWAGTWSRLETRMPDLGMWEWRSSSPHHTLLVWWLRMIGLFVLLLETRQDSWNTGLWNNHHQKHKILIYQLLTHISVSLDWGRTPRWSWDADWQSQRRVWYHPDSVWCSDQKQGDPCHSKISQLL